MGSTCSLHNSEKVVSPQQDAQPKEFNQHKSIRISERRASRDSHASDQETKVVEVRKAHSFKLPPPRVNLIGFKTLPFGNGKKSTEEINAEIICSYLPQHLLYNLKSLYKKNNNANEKKKVEEEMSSDLSPLSNFTYDTCILMIDISGFTNLTESLSKEPNGAELLTKYINQYFTTLIAFIYDFGGDIERFAGDAIICQFHYPRKDRTLAECVIAAVQCALRIQQTEYLKSFKVNDQISLQIHCGVSLGSVTTHHLGGVNDYWLRITSGQALLEMNSALGNSLVGQVVITRPAYEKCSNYITCRKLDVKDADVFVALASKREPISGISLPILTVNSNFIPILRKFISPPVRNKIDAGQSEWINEVKPLTIGFLSIIDTNKYETKEDEMQAYQTYLTSIQDTLETYEGFIANMLSDEKGTILVFSFGYPVSHISDPVRAVKAGIDLSNNLSRLGMKFGLGIASGKCFIGNVGSEYRKEFTIYGDKVNLAARLMKESEKNDGVILCEEDTSQMLKGIPIEPLEPIKVKGKSDMIKIWRVKDSSISSTQMYYNMKKTPSQVLEDHSESSDKKSYSGSEHLYSLKYPIGRESIFDNICKYVNEKLEEFEQGKKTRTKVIIVKGEDGVGKSDLLRRLVSEWKSKLACVYNSAIEFETPFYLYLGNLKISLTERVYKMNGWDLDYNDIENLYNNIGREQREELLLETFKEERDRENLYLLNSVIGTEFKESKRKKDEDERIVIASDLFARFLSSSWLYMGYSTQPWFLLYDDFHFTLQFDPYSRIVTKKILELEPGMTNCILLLSCSELPDVPQLAEKRKELDDWKSKADLIVELKEFNKQECEEYLKLYFGASKVDSKVLELVHEKTEGNQQFLTMALHFLQEGNRTYVEDGCLKFKLTSMDTVELPATMSSFFQQKVDKLDVDSQLVLKVASSIGLQFDFNTLEAIFPKESKVKKERKLPEVLNNLVGSHQFLEVVEETKGKHFLPCSSSKEKTYKFKSSMMLQIVYSTTPKEQKREFHMDIAKYFIKIIEQQCRKHKSRERASYFIKEIAFHLGHYYDKISLEEMLTLENGDKDNMLHLALACIIIPKAIILLQDGQETAVFKHLCSSFNIILEKLIVMWKGEKEGTEVFKFTELLDISNLNVYDSVLSLFEITRKRYDGMAKVSNTFSILGINYESVRHLLAKSLFKYGSFLQKLFDSNMMSISEEAFKKAKQYCPESEKELLFEIEAERWFSAFYLNKTDDAVALSSNLVNLSTDVGDSAMQLFGSISCMMSHNTRGNFNKVILFSEEVVNQYLSDPEKYHYQSISRFRKVDALLVSTTYSMRSLWSVGKYESAFKYYTLGSEQSKVRLHLPSFMFFFSFSCYYLLISGQLDELERSANQGMSIITIFSTSVASPNQVLSTKFYISYVQFCRELISAENKVEKEQTLRDKLEHMESLFTSIHIYAPPSLIFNYAILESRVKYLEFLDRVQLGVDLPYLEHTEKLFKDTLGSHQENLFGEIFRLQSRYLLIKCSLLESSFEDCLPNVEKSYSDALQFVSSQSAHGIKFRILLDMYESYHFLITKGLKELETKLPSLIEDMDYLMETYIEQHETMQVLNNRYQAIKRL